MKKKALAMVLATTMVAIMAVGCGSKTDAPAADKGSTETAAAGDDTAAGSGKVYLLNFKTESDAKLPFLPQLMDSTMQHFSLRWLSPMLLPSST